MARSRNVSLLQSIQTTSGAHPAWYSLGTGGAYYLRFETDRSPACCAEVKNEWMCTSTPLCTGCGRNNSHILKAYKNQTTQGTQKILLFIKSTYDAIFFSNTFKGNIVQVPAVIDDKLLKPFTEVVHGFAGHRGRNGADFLSYCLL